MLDFGSAAGDGTTFHPGLTATEAYNIDSKLDDGLPASGKVMTYVPAAQPNCATSATPSAANYNVSGSGIACSLIFITGL